jgi:CRP/FNR family transcriptional regulator
MFESEQTRTVEAYKQRALGVSVKVCAQPAFAGTSLEGPVKPLRLRAEGNVGRPPERCGICALRASCFPCDRAARGEVDSGEMVITDRRVRRGETLYRAGDAFHFLYAVRGGIFKTVRNLGDGREQVTGFQMTGDMLGADAIEARVHGSDAVALDESRVCAIRYSGIEKFGRAVPEMHHQLRKAMSCELANQQCVILLLGTMTAEERVAMFLLNLSQRFKAHGYSATEFTLRMTRLEIGSYLGIKIETVSRMLSRLRDEGLINARREQIQILDPAGLTRCAGRLAH